MSRINFSYNTNVYKVPNVGFLAARLAGGQIQAARPPTSGHKAANYTEISALQKKTYIII